MIESGNPKDFWCYGDENEIGAAAKALGVNFEEGMGALSSAAKVVGEHFHPLWGGNVDVPSYIAFQETPLQPF